MLLFFILNSEYLFQIIFGINILMEKEFYVNDNAIANNFACSSFQLFLTTEHNYLSISVLIFDNNQYYSSHFTLDKLIHINKKKLSFFFILL